MLDTQGAQWLSDNVFGAMGLDGMPLLATIALISAFNILIHLGFASATSLSSALIPVFIALTTTISLDGNDIGFVIIQQFVISFGFLLPVACPSKYARIWDRCIHCKRFLKIRYSTNNCWVLTNSSIQCNILEMDWPFYKRSAKHPFLNGRYRFALDKTYFNRINEQEIEELSDVRHLAPRFFSVILLRLFVRRSPKTSFVRFLLVLVGSLDKK